jgi:hypothetical protein
LVYQKSFVSLQVKITNNINLKTKVMNNENEIIAANIKKINSKIVEYLKSNNYDLPSRIVLKISSYSDGIIIIKNIDKLSLRKMPIQNEKFGDNYELRLTYNRENDCFYLNEIEDITLI